MGFLAIILNKENNCAVCWTKIVQHLSSADLKVGRVLKLWQQFFLLRCIDKADFLRFYSDAKSILHKLKEAKSVAVSDDNFLRAFFAKAIDAPEFTEQTKLFLKDFEQTPVAILELVHADNRAQETGEILRDNDVGKARSLLRRVGNDKQPEAAKPEWRTCRFPVNSNNQIPPEYYKQVKDWFLHAAVPEEKKTEEDKAWLAAFSFKHNEPKKAEPPHKKWQERKSYQKPSHQSRRSRPSRSRSYDSRSYDSHDEHPSDRRDSRQRMSRRGRPDNDGGYGRGNHRNHDNDRSRDRDRSPDRASGDRGADRNGRRARSGVLFGSG